MHAIGTTHEPARIMGLRISAIAEILILLIGLVLLDAFWFHSQRFLHVNPHPFWIPVLLMAVQYGTNEALCAAALATICLMVGNGLAPPAGEAREAWLYQVSINPVLWFVGGWALGELRHRQLREREMLRQALEEARDRESLIAESYRYVRDRKEALERQVAGQLTSAVAAYRAAKAVESLDPQSVVGGIEALVKAVMGADKFSLFVHRDSLLQAVILHGWENDDHYAREFDSFHSLYQGAVVQQSTLLAANEEQELALAGEGLLAAPIIDPGTQQVVGVLKIEEMDFLSLSLSAVENFRALCDWIGAALMHAQQFQVAKEHSAINPQSNILSYSFFQRQSEYLARLGKRVGFDVSLVVITLDNARALSEADRITIARQIADSMRTVLRSVDLAFDYQTDGEEYSVLLPATPLAGAHIVQEKIARELMRVFSAMPAVRFNYQVQAMHAQA